MKIRFMLISLMYLFSGKLFCVEHLTVTGLQKKVDGYNAIYSDVSVDDWCRDSRLKNYSQLELLGMDFSRLDEERLFFNRYKNDYNKINTELHSLVSAMAALGGGSLFQKINEEQKLSRRYLENEKCLNSNQMLNILKRKILLLQNQYIETPHKSSHQLIDKFSQFARFDKILIPYQVEYFAKLAIYIIDHEKAVLKKFIEDHFYEDRDFFRNGVCQGKEMKQYVFEGDEDNENFASFVREMNSHFFMHGIFYKNIFEKNQFVATKNRLADIQYGRTGDYHCAERIQKYLKSYRKLSRKNISLMMNTSLQGGEIKIKWNAE